MKDHAFLFFDLQRKSNRVIMTFALPVAISIFPYNIIQVFSRPFLSHISGMIWDQTTSCIYYVVLFLSTTNVMCNVYFTGKPEAEGTDEVKVYL